jgi:hypothetical protein
MWCDTYCSIDRGRWCVEAEEGDTTGDSLINFRTPNSPVAERHRRLLEVPSLNLRQLSYAAAVLIRE